MQLTKKSYESIAAVACNEGISDPVAGKAFLVAYAATIAECEIDHSPNPTGTGWSTKQCTA
jgi:hypothetical protein